MDVVFVVNQTQAKDDSKSSSVFAVVKATFTRDYSEGRLPDWTISKF
jgi:hypothetical protein